MFYFLYNKCKDDKIHSSLQELHCSFPLFYYIYLLLASLLLFLLNNIFKTLHYTSMQIQDMDFRLLQFLTIFLLHLFLCSGSSISKKPPLEEINQRKQNNHEFRILLSPSISTSILANIPIVNPTTPGTTTPTPNPTSPSTEPITNPTTPINSPAAPIITTPTTPTTTITPPTSPAAPMITTPTAPTTTTTPPAISSGGGNSWCIANQGASPTALQVALDYACGYGGADCSAIQPGGSCYEPTNVQNHASYAFNDYYQKHPGPTSCVFGGTAQLTNTDPSNGNCHYAASSPTSVTPPPGSITPPATLPPPPPTTTTTTMSPPTITGPGGDTVYGSAEPTGLPSSASSVSFTYLLLIFATIDLAWSLVAANKL